MRILWIVLWLLPEFISAQVPISEARKMKTGKTVTVAGRVTAAKEFGKLSFIQDATGGIGVYNGNINSIGDSVVVTGELSKYNGLLEIISDSVRFVVHKTPINPRTITKPDNFEGQLVRFQNVPLSPHGLFFYPQRAGVLINGSDTIQYWIDENTDIPGYNIPSSSSITGIVGKYGSKFQVMPRSHLDIENITSTSKPTTNNIRIMNWNLEFFGAPKYGPSNDLLQLSNISKVLTQSNAHIIALQEISNDNLFKQLLQSLPGYDGRCSSRYSYSFDPIGDFPPQKLCFIYNTSVVKVLREKVLFRKMFDQAPSDMFSSGRLPYVIDVEVNGHRISVINIHGKSGAAQSDRIRRGSDAQMLKDTLDVYYASKDFILLGDFNDDLDQSIVPGFESPYSEFTSDHHYNCVSRTLSDLNWHSTLSYDDMIDHQIISSSLANRYVDGSVHIANPFLAIPLYGRTTSDHLPVMSEFDFNKTITGIQSEQQLTVYPNPTSNEVWFAPNNSDVTLLNSMGTVILTIKNAQSPISLSNCAPGFYLLTIGNQIHKIMKTD